MACLLGFRGLLSRLNAARKKFPDQNEPSSRSFIPLKTPPRPLLRALRGTLTGYPMNLTRAQKCRRLVVAQFGFSRLAGVRQPGVDFRHEEACEEIRPCSQAQTSQMETARRRESRRRADRQISDGKGLAYYLCLAAARLTPSSCSA